MRTRWPGSGWDGPATVGACTGGVVERNQPVRLAHELRFTLTNHSFKEPLKPRRGNQRQHMHRLVIDPASCVRYTPGDEEKRSRHSYHLRAVDACHVTEQYANNPVENDHGLLKARLRPMRGLKRLRSVRVISAGHAFVQNLRRGHYELGVDIDPRHRLTAIFTELARAI